MFPRRCDGRDTPSPTANAAPSVPGGADNVSGSGGEICALCDGTSLLLDESKSVRPGMTCVDLDHTIRTGNVLVGSATCNDVREMYRSSCCYDECQLCQSPEGIFLDLRDELVVRQGGYEASCQEISSILSALTTDNTICADARSQLGGECCYEQCSLCGDQSETSTEWYAEVTFQGLATTCLGIDYMLRTEQISNGSIQCSELQRSYMDRCCYAGSPGGLSNNASPSEVATPQQQPSPGAGAPSNPFPGEVPNPASHTPKNSPGAPAPMTPGQTPPRSSSNPTLSTFPSTPEGQVGMVKRNTPSTRPSYWNAEPSGSDFSWENWDSPNGGYQVDFSLIIFFGTLSTVFSFWMCVMT